MVNFIWDWVDNLPEKRKKKLTLIITILFPIWIIPVISIFVFVSIPIIIYGIVDDIVHGRADI